MLTPIIYFLLRINLLYVSMRRRSSLLGQMHDKREVIAFDPSVVVGVRQAGLSILGIHETVSEK